MSFQRRARPQVEDDSDGYGITDSSAESQKVVGKQLAGSGGKPHPEDERISDSESGTDEEGEGSSDDEEGNAQGSIAQISFGTLARAQKSLLKDRQKPSPISRGTRIAVAKARLAAILPSNAEKPRKPQEDLRRSSKHAPQELSSKRAVTRKREVIAPIIPPSQAVRDPRFDDAVKGTFDERTFKDNYSFLNDYREQEIKMLKEEISKCRDETTREQLAKSLLSLESKRKTEEDKEQAQGVVREHKKKERELIKQGKKPFYLKKAEQKKLLLLQKYSKLNEKQLEKVIEKKRKRKSQKERKSMPFERRAG